MFGLQTPHYYHPGMSHESKSLSLGMISTATRTTATVSPLSPLANGNAAAQSSHSGFAAALRKLAKQAEDPRGSSLSGESSPVSSPATSHSSPVTTPKRSSLGPLLAQSKGRSVPSTPPVVTIAPTKTSSSLWRVDGRQVETGVRGHSRENTQPQDKGGHPLVSPHHLRHSFGLTPGSVMQDPRLQSLSLPGQVHPAVPAGAVPEEYLRGLRPFATSDDLRLTSLPLGLDPATAAHAAAAAYYHPAYLHHPLTLHSLTRAPSRMEESLCLSALRSQFYSMPAGGAFPPLHPSALHMHLPGARYPGELTHTVLAERLQMENELRQRERERERENEREREAELERERERERGEEREREREREVERQKERQRERQQQMVRAVESHYLAELQALRAPPEDRPRPGETMTPSRLDKSKESALPAPKPLSLKPSLHSSMGSVPHLVPSLVPSHVGKHHAVSTAGIHGTAAAMTQRANDEERWLTRQRRPCHEREVRAELGLRSPGEGAEPKRDSHGSNSAHYTPASREAAPRLGAPPPLISPKPQPHAPIPPTTLWNPASHVESVPDSRRRFNPPATPSRPPPGLTRAERSPGWGERLEEGGRRRTEGLDRYPPMRGSSLPEPCLWKRLESERSSHGFHHQVNHPHQRPFPHLPAHSSGSEPGTRPPASCPSPPVGRQCQAPDPVLVYDEVLQQHRRLLSKLDLEEKRRREAREGGYFYSVDDSYDESDEEEVKAHLKRVTEQPPLKLDTSSNKVEFLGVCGLTTLAHRDELLCQKRRKRRRMLRERSLSPPAVPGKRKTPSPPSPLTTRFTPEQMDRTPQLEDKKHFLTMFRLGHVTPQQRREKEKTEELLKAIQRKTVTLDTLRYNPLPSCSSPPAPETGESSASPPNLSNGLHYPDSPSTSPSYTHPHNSLNSESSNNSVDTPACRPPPPLAPHPEKAGLLEGLPAKKLRNGVGHSALQKELSPGQNGRSRPWERFTPEAFAQHFHQAVLQSTHGTQQKTSALSNSGIKSDPSLPHHIPPLKRPNSFHHQHHPKPQSTHTNGRYSHLLPAHQDPQGLRDQLSEEEEEESGEEEDEEEMSEAPRRWQGIESIFEAYHEHLDETRIEREVLHCQCRRLEAQNYTLTRTAEQLSLSMGELVSRRQNVGEERERLQAQLEHFRKCLTLPNVHWGRGQANGHTPR
ncbi:genetic suppressor element 1-like [Aplochiton taeniatus]